jgi:hypothetical protein
VIAQDDCQIIHVVPDDWGAYVDIKACLESLATRRRSTRVITPNEFLNSRSWAKDTFFVSWALFDPLTERGHRSYKIAYVYSEALDANQSKLLPAHLSHWRSFAGLKHKFDAVFAHTPRAAEIVKATGLPTFVMPAGWDASAMGVPRWRCPKHHTVAYHGSMVGRRELIVPYLKEGIDGFEDVTGLFGRGLLGRLDVTRASLYIAHSMVESFSTWRLWQVASTSAALIAENGDTWPFEAGKHFVPIDHMTLDNAKEVTHEISGWLRSRDRLNDIANEAHKLAQRYTVDRVEDEFVFPAIEALR